MSIAGQTALVVGAASGLGRAVALRFVAEGASVVAFDRSVAKLDALRAECPGAVVPVAGDVRDADSWSATMATVDDRFGGLDTMVITAGIVDFVGSFLDYDATALSAAFAEVMGINVLGAVGFALAAYPMLERSGGSIALTLSTSAWLNPASGPLYGMSKAALTMAVRQLAYDMAPRVRVNGVVPGGFVDTDIRGPDSLGQGEVMSRIAERMAAGAAPRFALVATVPDAAAYTGVYMLLADKQEAAVATGGLISWDAGIGVLGHGSWPRTALMNSGGDGGTAP